MQGHKSGTCHDMKTLRSVHCVWVSERATKLSAPNTGQRPTSTRPRLPPLWARAGRPCEPSQDVPIGALPPPL